MMRCNAVQCGQHRRDIESQKHREVWGNIFVLFPRADIRRDFSWSDIHCSGRLFSSEAESEGMPEPCLFKVLCGTIMDRLRYLT
jgi:hypothetical protein